MQITAAATQNHLKFTDLTTLLIMFMKLSFSFYCGCKIYCD